MASVNDGCFLSARLILLEWERNKQQVTFQGRRVPSFPTSLCLLSGLLSPKRCGFLLVWRFLLLFLCPWNSPVCKMCDFLPHGLCPHVSACIFSTCLLEQNDPDTSINKPGVWVLQWLDSCDAFTAKVYKGSGETIALSHLICFRNEKGIECYQNNFWGLPKALFSPLVFRARNWPKVGWSGRLASENRY